MSRLKINFSTTTA